MANEKLQRLTRRERQIMDALYRKGEASVADVREGIPDPPGYSAVRTMLNRMETKGFVRHEREGNRYIYRPAVSPDEARVSALKRMVRTFFEGSTTKTVAALLDQSSGSLTVDELAELEEIVERLKEQRT